MSASYSKVTLIGYVGADPEGRRTAAGDPLTTFRLAVSERPRAGEERTSWYAVAAFGRLAEICAAYVRRGALIFVEGGLTLRPYTDRQGVERVSADVRALEVRLLDRRPAEGEGSTPASTDGPAEGTAGDAGWSDDEVPF